MELIRKAPPVPPTAEETADALVTAESAVDRWQAEVEAKAHATEVCAAELAEAEALAAEDVLANPEVIAEIAANLTKLRTEQEVAGRAVVAARQRLDEARRAALAARVALLRSRARELRDAAAVRRAKTDQLLAQLREHEQLPYVPAAAGRPLSELALLEARSLDGQANKLVRLVERGSAVEIARVAARTLPVPNRIEFDVVGGTAPAEVEE